MVDFEKEYAMRSALLATLITLTAGVIGGDPASGNLSGPVYQSGVASYYWQRQRVASGGWFDPKALTAAHKTLPFGTKVRVTHARSRRSVVVTINDRGPYVPNRVIDLSLAAASALGMTGSGVARVQLAVEGR
jgi:rare lipoprotein A